MHELMRSMNGLTHARLMGFGIHYTLCGKLLKGWTPAGFVHPIELDWYKKNMKFWHCPYCFEILMDGLDFITEKDIEL